MAQKPSIPKGTRDFNPEQVAKRNYIFNTIRGTFETFGFQPIETPSFENSETLMGKYGDEGDRLIFKILNSGEFFANTSQIIKSKTYLEKIINPEFFINFFNNEIPSKSKPFKNVKLLTDKIEDEEREIIKDSLLIFLRKNKDNFEYHAMQQEWKFFLRTVLNNHFSILYDSTLNIVSKISLGADRQLYESDINILVLKILNSYFSRYLPSAISEKALRYDLTVPFARYVVQHQNDIEFPFKRYQIQPVWRADRPQKGRFREFYQCDADVVGSKSLWQEVEFIQLYDTVFSALKLEGVTIKINNRKILSGIAEIIGASDKLIDFTVALDKLDKIGEAKVKEEMLSKGISEAGISKLQPLFTLSGSFESQMESLKDILSTSDEGKKGIEELAFINEAISELGLKTASLQLDVTLARGLNYYTGAIFEVAAPKTVQMGSIGGGGRYDDLTGIFGLKDVSGVGISFGLDRIYLVLEELGLFPETVTKNVDVLFINFGEKEALFCLKAIKQLRSEGINTELYPDADKMKKQMNHANKRNIPFVVLVGEAEVSSNSYTLKNMVSGEQFRVSFDELLTHLK